MKDCKHTSIVLVKETPQGEIGGVMHYEEPKTYVICEDCEVILPIYRITSKDIKVPLTQPIN